MLNKRVAILCAAAAAVFSMSTQAQAQGLFGYPVYSRPCATGNCGVRPTLGYGMSPCATGNCPTPAYRPTSGYVIGSPVANCPGGNCSTGQCPGGVCAPGQCQTICGPNGCQTVCPAGYSSPCGPNGCPPSFGVTNTGFSTTSVPSLNLDQAPVWTGQTTNSPSYLQNTGFNGASTFRTIAPARGFVQPQFSGVNAPVTGGYFGGAMETNIVNDPMVRLN
jgi:hypothetical protein